MREDVEKLKKHCSQHVSNDEEEFAKKREATFETCCSR